MFAGEVLESGTLVENNVCEEQEIIATGLTDKSGTTHSYGKLDEESDYFWRSTTKCEVTQTLKPAASWEATQKHKPGWDQEVQPLA